jgi:hypothetical protein
MTATHFANHKHTHHLYANEDGYDLAFIEAEHYDREASCQPTNPAQFPLNGKSVIEHYAPQDVTVLALPTLYCMAHAFEHPCAHQHTIAPDMGVCDLDLVNDADKYVPARHVSITASKTYTGRIERKASV